MKGVTHAYTYEGLHRLTQVGSGKNNSAISNYAYTLGLAGNRLTVAELSGRSVSYGYDSLYRLTSEAVTSDPAGKNRTVSYTYDNVGNRKTLNSTLPPTGAMNYSYDANDRLSSDTYDANGNTILSSGISDTYDFENHLIQKGGVTIVYDGDGNRVTEAVGGVTTKYLVDTVNPTGYAQVVDELQGGSISRTYSYGLERISETQTINSTATTSFYGYDGHGSVRQLTNSTGAVTDTYDYDAFGNLINSIGSIPNNYLFAGEQYDPALGLYYNRARYLNTTTGRFWSMDSAEGSLGDPLSLHKYTYAGSDPVNKVDPTGHDFSIGSVTFTLGISQTIFGLSVLQSGAIIGAVVGAGFGAFSGAVGAYADNSSPEQIEDATQRNLLISMLLGAVGGYAQAFRVTRVLFQLAIYGMGGASAVSDIRRGKFATAALTVLLTIGLGAIGKISEGINSPPPLPATEGAIASTTPMQLPPEVYSYPTPETADIIESSQLGLPDRILYLTPDGTLTPLQAQLDLALPQSNTAEAEFAVDTSQLDQSKVILSRRVTGNVYGRPGGGTEILYDGQIPLSAVRRVK